MAQCDGLFARAVRVGTVILVLSVALCTQRGGPARGASLDALLSSARLCLDRWFDQSVDPWRDEWRTSASAVGVVKARVVVLVQAATGMPLNDRVAGAPRER